MSEREAAYKAYQERQKSKNPSTFDTMGAFNKYYNNPQNITSLAVPLDFGKAIPAKERSALLEQFDAASRTAPKAVVPQSMQPVIAGSGFWTKLFAGMERAYNLSAQAASFALTLPEPTNPLYQDANVLKNLRESWQSARQISPGQAFQTNVTGGILGAPISLAENAPAANRFIDENALFLSSEFDIFNAEERQKAFREQTVGRWSSFATDVVARFTIDPTLIAGKALKAARAARLAVKPGEVSAVLAGEQTGKRAERIKGTLQNFVEGTDGMNESDLFRVDAIRKSANPASMADIMATANKIEDTATRHRVKTGIVQWAMGDPKGAEDLLSTSKEVAAKIGNLESEIFEAKYFGAGIDDATGQLTMDLLNSGTNLEKNEVLLAQYEEAMNIIYKKLNTEGVLDPRKLPEINFGSVIRQEFSRSQEFIDVRAGAASIPVRVMTGFFYKRPKGWIDFTDNQSVQTLDNMLNQVRNVSEGQIVAYSKILDNLRSKLEVINNDPAMVKATKNQIKEIEGRIKSATFTVDRKNELLSRFTSATNPTERASAYMQIEEELFTIIGDQFGFTPEQIRRAWATYAPARARAHNLIRTRLYTAAKDPATGGPAGGIVKGVIGDDGVPMIFPAPINESQLVKQLPTLDIPMMYSVLNKATRAQRFEYFGEKYRLPMSKASKVVGKTLDSTAQVRAAGNEMVDSIDALLKFQVLARLGYPQRNVGEGNLRIIFILGPMAVMSRAAGLLKSGYKNLLENRFVGASNEDIFEWSNKSKLLAKRDELEASIYYVDDADLVNRQIAEIDAMLSGKKPIKERFGMGLNQIKVGDQIIKYEDALGATPAQAKYINDRFIANAARVIDDHFSELGKSTRNVMESNGDWTLVRGTDEGWLDAYIRVVNRQMRNSPLTRIFMQNKPQDVIVREAREFLYKDPKGRVIRKNLLASGGRTVEDIINANLLNVDQVFPAYINPEIKELALSRALDKDDIARFYGTDPSIRPDVNGAQISAANGTSAAFTLLAKALDKFYDVFGEIPERGLVRNTMFISLYRQRMKAEVENAIANYPGDEIPDWYMRKMESNARQWARAEMRRSLYDTSERVESARYLRYGFPFFGAFADVAEKWGRILFDDPTVLRKLDIVYNSPDRAGMTEERDGITYINIPGSWAKRMGLGDRPRAIPKPSLNLIFQGGEWWNPGAGWFVQHFVSRLIKRTPELERNAIVKEILPYGASGTGWKDLLIQSPAARQALNIFNEDNPTRQNLTVLIMAEENAKFDQGLRDTKPTITEINNRVKKQLGIEVAARLTLPFASGNRSPYQFYIDAYQSLREQDPFTATEEFYKRYGDSFYLFTTSLSKNVTGIAATIEADKTASQFKDLIAKNPDYGWFVVGSANAGEFSPTVYRKQFQTPVAPGSTVTYRTTQDAYEAIADTKAELGWIKYNKGMDIIEAIRIQRGLPSLSSRGAEDLRIAKQALVTALEQENPDWAKIRGKIDLNKITNFLRFAQDAIKDPRLTNRPDMKTMASYLQARDIIRKELSTRESKSINAESNSDLKVAWDTVVGLLIDQDVTFNRIYTRILENDDLTKGL
jgi:hypothetical protein